MRHKTESLLTPFAMWILAILILIAIAAYGDLTISLGWPFIDHPIIIDLSMATWPIF